MRRKRRARLEQFALFMLLAGSLLLPVVGWLIAIALVWNSRIWTARDKLIATLCPPGGFLPAIYLLLMPSPWNETCTGGSTAGGATWERCVGGPSPFAQTLLSGAAILVAIMPFATAIHLNSRLAPADPAPA